MALQALRTAAVAVLAVAVVAGLGGCQTQILPPCPSVRIDSTTANLVKFRDGGGQTPADVAYEAQLVSFAGQCENADDGIAVTLDVDGILAAGPATEGGRADLYYFVAIPQLFPKPKGKSIFRVRADIPKRAGAREDIAEHGIRIFIPLKQDEPAAAYDIYVGFQLDDAQLAFNRARRQQ
jgi:hypothetical protein